MLLVNTCSTIERFDIAADRFPNGPKSILQGRTLAGLSKAVRDYRHQALRKFLCDNDYDAIAIVTSEWLRWATNHTIRALAWERPFLVIITADGKSCAFMSELSRHQIESEIGRDSFWIDEVTFYGESPGAKKYGWILSDWSEMVSESIGDIELASASICADQISEPLKRVASQFSNLNVSVAPEALKRLRWVKHDDEIATMRQAALLSDWAMNVYREKLRPGLLLAEFDYSVAAQLAAESARRLPGENFVIGSMTTMSGAASASPHGDGAPTGKVLENNCVAITGIASQLNGLTVELARPWLIGSPGARAIATFECALAAQTAAIGAAVAGQPVCGIHLAAEKVIESNGYGTHFRLRAAHGIGGPMHDYPEDLAFNERSLFANETYAIEPGLNISNFGTFRFSDTIVVGETEPIQLGESVKDRAQQSLKSY